MFHSSWDVSTFFIWSTNFLLEKIRWLVLLIFVHLTIIYLPASHKVVIIAYAYLIDTNWTAFGVCADRSSMFNRNPFGNADRRPGPPFCMWEMLIYVLLNFVIYIKPSPVIQQGTTRDRSQECHRLFWCLLLPAFRCHQFGLMSLSHACGLHSALLF
jgi:hypothetical protein